MPLAPLKLLADPSRLDALEQTQLLDSMPEEAFDRLTRLAARIVGAPTALVSLVDDHRQFFKSFFGLPEPWASARETPLSHSFCQHVVATNEPLVVTDARTDPRVHDNLAIPDLNVIAYAGMPLQDLDGHTLGSFCVIDDHPRQWTEAELSVLRDLAAGVMAEIRLRAQLAARERMQAQLVEATREAERANHAKSDFLNRMSHELRTPLNSIIGFANLILQRGGSRPASERTYIERIRDNGMHLLGLINEVLDIARVESGHLEITLGIVDVGALVRGVIAQLESRVAGTPVSLRAEVPEDMRAITSDEVRLRQVLINLVGNALKFTQEGSVTVRVTADAQGTPCTIAVVDTGIGIPAERLQAIFEPFEQADASTSVRFGGTGLGLAISRDLCRLMGCALHVESVVGRGSTFTIELPERPPRP